MTTRLLFLDVDGVLNSLENKAIVDGLYGIAPEHVMHLNRIVEEVPDLIIVLSSTWRLHHTVDEMNNLLSSSGFVGTIADKTPYGGSICSQAWAGNRRGHEIATWLMENDYYTYRDKIVILDDDSDMGSLLPFLIKTSWAEGLTSERAQVVIDRFSQKVEVQ